MTNVLLIEDDADFSRNIAEFLEKEFQSVSIHKEDNIDNAIFALKNKRNKFDICIIDMRLPVNIEYPEERPDGGLEILDFILDNNIKTFSLVLTAHGHTYIAKESIKKGAMDYIEKSEKWKEILKKKVTDILEKRLER